MARQYNFSKNKENTESDAVIVGGGYTDNDAVIAGENTETADMGRTYVSPFARTGRNDSLPFATGFDPSQYSFRYIRHDNLARKCAELGFVIVNKETHGSWFQPHAFNEYGTITQGVLNNGTAELTLCVRPMAYVLADRKAKEDARKALESGRIDRINDENGSALPVRVTDTSTSGYAQMK